MPVTRLTFCTYCDENYLPRALALVASLREHAPGFRIFVLALTEQCGDLLKKLQEPEIITIPLEELEAWDTGLAGVSNSRSIVEYYFTLSPCLPRYILARFPDLEWITYLDSDLYFYASPARILDQLDATSVAIIGHRYPPGDCRAESFGLYNVGWISFRNDEEAWRCLDEWRYQCLEWCFDRAENGRFADQKYLDEWPQSYAGVLEVAHPGANLALWNINGHTLSESPNGGLRVDGQPLVFFHFHGIRARDEWFVEAPFKEYCTPVPVRRFLIRRLFRPYLIHLLNMEERLRACGSNVRSFASSRHLTIPSRPVTGVRRAWQYWLRWWRPRRASLMEASLIRIPRRNI